MDSAKKALFTSPNKTKSSTQRPASPTKGGDKSPNKVQLGRDTYFTKTVEIKTNANKAAIGRDILFSQRQAKSKVLVRETVKTGLKLTFRNYAHRTDTLIKESLADIDKFRNSYAKPSTFKGWEVHTLSSSCIFSSICIVDLPIFTVMYIKFLS